MWNQFQVTHRPSNCSNTGQNKREMMHRSFKLTKPVQYSSCIPTAESNLSPRRSLYDWGVEEVPILFNFFMLFVVILLTLELAETRAFQMQTFIVCHYEE